MDNLITIGRQYLESIACCDFQKLKQLLHEKYTYTNTLGQKSEGPDLRFETAGLIFNAIPDLSFDIQKSYQLGNIIITELIMKGTHIGEKSSIPAFGNRIAIPACRIVEIENGLILSEREYYDHSSLLQQMSIIESYEQNNRLMA